MTENIDLIQDLDTNPTMASKTTEVDQVGSRYPYYPLSAALKVAEAIKDLGGARTSVKKSLLAKQLGAVENSAAFAQQLASARTYGVIEGRGDSSLTELSKKYFFPTSETDKSVAFLKMFATPTAFGELLKRFDGDRLPTREILGNILHRELGIPESWKDRVAALFSNSAQTVGVIDAQGFLRYDAALHSGQEAQTPLPPAEEAPVSQSELGELAIRRASNSTVRPVTVGKVFWQFKTIEVTTPEDLDRNLWEKLEGYVKLLEPQK